MRVEQAAGYLLQIRLPRGIVVVRRERGRLPRKFLYYLLDRAHAVAVRRSDSSVEAQLHQRRQLLLLPLHDACRKHAGVEGAAIGW